MPKQRVTRHEVVQPPDKSIRLIPLTRNLNSIVDAIDYEWLLNWNWHAAWNPKTKSFYAKTNDYRFGVKMISMHREILGCTTFSEKVDHKNHDTLDNRRQNLRKCTNSQNMQSRGMTRVNTSGFKGVYFDGRKAKWKALIIANGKRKTLGRFVSKVDAARAYNEAAKVLHGEFAHLNSL